MSNITDISCQKLLLLFVETTAMSSQITDISCQKLPEFLVKLPVFRMKTTDIPDQCRRNFLSESPVGLDNSFLCFLSKLTYVSFKNHKYILSKIIGASCHKIPVFRVEITNRNYCYFCGKLPIFLGI